MDVLCRRLHLKKTKQKKHWIYTRQADAEQHNQHSSKTCYKKKQICQSEVNEASDGHTDTAGSA